MKLKRITEVLTAVLFAAVLLFFCVFTLLRPKQAVSESERRKLKALPEFSTGSLLSGEYFSELSDYAVDHFALREPLRTVNTAVRTGVFAQKAVGGVFEENNVLYMLPKMPDERAVLQAAQKFQTIKDTYFEGKNVYLSIIPDKADFAQARVPGLDTDALVSLMCEHFDGAYIDILETLERDDFYRTDTHWRQERLEDTAGALVRGMGLEFSDSLENYAQKSAGEFHGVLWGRYAIPIPGDELIYLENEVTESAFVSHIDYPNTHTVYDPDKDSPDPYDLFLSGASSIVEIESPLAQSDRHLVLFRDSFGSSLAPWLLTEYGKITMIDIRYVASAKLGEFTELETADDVLFLYSTSILNTGGVLK